MVNFRWQGGVTYLWMLFLVFLLGLGLGKSLEVYSHAVQREKEEELLYVGGLYRDAIKKFYLSSPGSEKKYPESLESLIRDPRTLTVRRYIRTIYRDPITGKAFVPLIAPSGGIWGVKSPSASVPLKQAGFQDPYSHFAGSGSYAQWAFNYEGR
jgi:hypothetical protein